MTNFDEPITLSTNAFGLTMYIEAVEPPKKLSASMGKKLRKFMGKAFCLSQKEREKFIEQTMDAIYFDELEFLSLNLHTEKPYQHFINRFTRKQ